MTPETAPLNMTYGESFDAAKSALSALSAISQDIPKNEDVEAAQAAWTALTALPRDHIIRISKRAVADRNNDALDHVSARAMDDAIFIENVMLSILSDEERVQVLGN